MIINIQTKEILLVEDNQGDIDLTLEAFRQCNTDYNINTCTDGSIAIQYLRKENIYSNATKPDLILLDINLPKKNGHEVLKIIKSDNYLKCIPVIMLTTSDSLEDINKSYENYANCYITKPSSLQGLFQIVKDLEKFWLKSVKLPSFT